MRAYRDRRSRASATVRAMTSSSTTTVPDEPAAARRPVSLLVIGDGAVRTIALAGPEVTIGRADECEVVVAHAKLSRRHAVLRLGPPVTVQDLGSTNGTFLNASVRIRRETTLKNGDILSFGEVQYWFLLTDTLYVKLRGGESRSRL